METEAPEVELAALDAAADAATATGDAAGEVAGGETTTERESEWDEEAVERSAGDASVNSEGSRKSTDTGSVCDFVESVWA